MFGASLFASPATVNISFRSSRSSPVHSSTSAPEPPNSMHGTFRSAITAVSLKYGFQDGFTSARNYAVSLPLHGKGIALRLASTKRPNRPRDAGSLAARKGKQLRSDRRKIGYQL